MRRPLIIALRCLMMTSALTGLAAQPARAGDGKERRPSLPPVETALTIEHAQVPIGYPRLTADIHAGYTTINTESMARSIDSALGTLGVQRGTSLPGSTFGLGFGLGLRVSYRLGFGLETELANGGDDLTTKYFGGMATFVVTPEHIRSYSLALGAGIGRQRISTRQQFHLLLAPDRLLEQVFYESDWVSVVPIAVVLEVPNHRYSRYALVTTVRHLPRKVTTDSIGTTFGYGASFPVEATLGGWILTIGMRVGL